MCAYVNVCEYVSVCREQCKKTQYWLFIYLHKIYSGYKKCCRLPVMQTWSRCVEGYSQELQYFGKETDKIGNNAEKKGSWIQNRKRKVSQKQKIICFFPSVLLLFK